MTGCTNTATSVCVGTANCDREYTMTKVKAMSNIDEKLAEIVNSAGAGLQGHEKQSISKIKQVFKDAGWVKVPTEVEETWRAYNKMAGYRTGQEWYDRYRTEWNRVCAMGNVTTDSHIIAAKKASGIEK